jgi:hypothetical protein
MMNPDDEANFWQQLIEWWKANNSEPATKWMYDGLRLAESKSRLAETR